MLSYPTGPPGFPSLLSKFFPVCQDNLAPLPRPSAQTLPFVPESSLSLTLRSNPYPNPFSSPCSDLLQPSKPHPKSCLLVTTWCPPPLLKDFKNPCTGRVGALFVCVPLEQFSFVYLSLPFLINLLHFTLQKSLLCLLHSALVAPPRVSTARQLA